MKLFGKSGKALERWRYAGRITDLHKTKVTIIDTLKEPQQLQVSPPWFSQIMLNAASRDSRPRSIDVPDPEVPLRCSLQGTQMTLMQFFGQQMDNQSASRPESFTEVYDRLFSHGNAPQVKYQNPDAW